MSYIRHLRTELRADPRRTGHGWVTTACGITASIRRSREGETGTFGAPIPEGSVLSVYPEINFTSRAEKVTCGRCQKSKIMRERAATQDEDTTG